MTTSHSREVFGLTILKNSHRAIRKLKNEHNAEIHGNKFWGSSYLLMDYFQDNPLPKGSQVMEAGAGWGLAGIYLAKQQGAKVTAIDADDQVFPYLQCHAELNEVDIDCVKKRFETITKKQLAEYDVLIAADICFWDELADIVYKLVKRAVQAGVKKIVIADPRRPPFLEMADRCQDEFFGELFDYRLTTPVRATGCVLVIENE